MPVHEYQCKAGHVTELWHMLDVRPNHTKCQTCGKRARPILSATPGVVKNPAAGHRKGQ